MKYQNIGTIRKNHNQKLLFITLFLLLYPNTSSSQFEIGNRIKNCWQAFVGQNKDLEQSKEAVFYIDQIRESTSKEDMIKIWEKVPAKLQTNVAQQIFTVEESVEIKQNLALVIGETGTNNSHIQMALVQSLLVALGQNKAKGYKLQKLLVKILPETEEFETKEFNLIKQNIVKSIRGIKPKDRKTQRILVDSLSLFKSENQADIRNEIYSFFEDISKDITTKTAGKLARRIREDISSEEKKRIIRILRKKNPKDTLTIQYLGEGLNDSDPEVRVATVEALEKILEASNSLKIIHSTGEFFTQSFIIYPIKSIFDVKNTVKDIRSYILEKLIGKALNDPEPPVQKAAIRAMVKVNAGYVMVTDTLIEILSSNREPEVENEAISALEETLSGFFNRRLFHFSTHIIKERKTVITQLTRAMYDKNQSIRRAARKAFRALYGSGKTARKSYYEVQDLKAKELQKRIAEYQITGKGLIYDNPNSQPANRVPPPFESWFEVEVFLKIHEEGYIVLPQYVHTSSEGEKEYRIDLVIVSSDKKEMSREIMLAVECDGYYHDKGDRKKEDERKQRVLKKEGWNIWKIRHSEEKTPSLPYPPFYSLYPDWKGRKINPKALNSLWKKLKQKQIEPIE